LVGLYVPRSSSAAANQTLTIHPSGGIYQGAVTVSIETPSRGLQIYFTTNGVLPSAQSGRVYSGPVSINATTVLRVIARLPSGETAESLTCTYLFPKDIVHQTGAGFPNTWGMKEGKGVPADYEMDPEIVNDSKYRGSIEPALRAIPSVSLVVAPEDLFDPARGLYSNPEQSGKEWERPASFELIGTNGQTQVRANCGIRIQGGWNRRPEESPKHSFRVIFKKKYGPGRIHYPLFGDQGPKEFEDFILRSGCNNSWIHWRSVERKQGEYIRDQWARDTMRDMGHASPAGFFVHLYLNGLYWGLYNLTERPDAAFAASHFGGVAGDYDAMNAGKILEGDRVAWDRLITSVNAGVSSDEQLRKIEEALDIDEFIDYMLVNYYGANADWDGSSNWYALRRRPSGRFFFCVWDAERTLEGVNDNTMSFDDDGSPPRIFHRLCDNASFRHRFAARVQQHLFGEGALTPKKAAERYRTWSDRLDLPILAESARWGDYRRDVHPYKEGPYELYTRDAHWRPEVNRLLNDYFPARTAIVLGFLRERGLAP
jgi:hypothetical protein